ncbi:molybdate ABC transporter substrate-binding protein [Paraliomyxa miuraensis]|uniref:molybdate ABC transporter substrate-binding protein n=1 Tax=Paraliomyxa miuraensis TaxID=376150 RepID=UPI00225818A1|nr:molybdate ABC transporter substrate-binding protein [Paraliomyxa miuraensis]MCX4246227.1 molybdate ABC transporter substrate-binding protein [Paraliomyxa miuraensis]
MRLASSSSPSPWLVRLGWIGPSWIDPSWIGLMWIGLACGCAPADATSRTLTVLAASSLTHAFGELEADFEASHPGVDVVVSTAGSQALRVQIEHGAPADVFASANAEHMQALVSPGLVKDAQVFAEGELVLVVPQGNPAGITSLEQLPQARRVVLATAEVPVGRYSRTMLDRAEQRYGPGFRARVEERVVSLEANVRLSLAKVELAEADATVVYRTDAAAAHGVEVIELPNDVNVIATYHVGVLTTASEPALAEAFVTHLRSSAGRTVLERHGFVSRDG